MSRQRARHLIRQPTEETIRAALAELVAAAGTIDVQRMSYDWRDDDVLVQIQLVQPLTGSTLLFFRRELMSRLRNCIPPDDPLQDWLVVIECAGETLARVAPNDQLEGLLDE